MQKLSHNIGSARCLFFIAIVIFVHAQIAHAQFWEKKPYQQWSKGETKDLLTDSPWAREIVIASTVSGDLSKKLSTGNNDAGSQVTYQVQIRSAKPIRQAVVEQFGPKYQQLPPDRKQAIDSNAEQFINAQSDEISFWVTYASDLQSGNMDLLHYWQTQGLATLKNTVWLQISGTDKAEPTYFAPGPGQTFEVRFPRPKELPANRSLVLEFRHPAGLAGQRESRVLAEFKVKKMAVGGTLLY
jgi:hypothetical protein